MRTVYLAGPTVFFPDAAVVYDRLKALCATYGLLGITPLDGEPLPALPPQHLAQAIYQANAEKVRACDAILADLSPFRGALEPDSGTCVEVGMALALGKPVSGYSPSANTPMADRIRSQFGSYGRAERGRTREFDNEFHQEIEDFGLSHNLMIAVPCPVFSAPELALQHIRNTIL